MGKGMSLDLDYGDHDQTGLYRTKAGSNRAGLNLLRGDKDDNNYNNQQHHFMYVCMSGETSRVKRLTKMGDRGRGEHTVYIIHLISYR
jgi:23S rRNA A1618 N6-methylase RlmF